MSPPRGATRPLKIAFITGFGRSGTTLVDNILAQVEGIFSAGELQYLWDRGAADDRLCSCRRTFSECPIWSRVAADALPDADPAELARLAAVRESWSPGRTLKHHLSGRGPDEATASYLDRLGRVVDTLRRETGARVIVDSSKSPGHGWLLRRLPGVEVYAIHLVRDARAVAWSWQKKKIYDDSGPEPMYMSRHSPARSARLWSVWNLATEILWRGDRRYLRMRYEAFAEAPEKALAEILGFLDEPADRLPFTGPSTVELNDLHTFAGNPSRFAEGPVEVRPDVGWRSQQPAGQRRLVTLLTWPLLLRYGYRLTA